MAYQIKIRRDTASNWTTNNPTLGSGEMGLETDTGFIKIGDGSADWSSLSYMRPSTGSKLPGETFSCIFSMDFSAAFPALRIDKVHTIDSATYLELFPLMYAEKLVVNDESSFSVTAASNVLTFSSTTTVDYLFAALQEDCYYHGDNALSYTNWRSITIDSVNYTITALDATARTITVSESIDDGSYTAYIYPWRIGSSTTSCRWYACDDTAVMSGDGTDSVQGLRQRDNFQSFSVQTTVRTNSAAFGASSIATENGSGTLSVDTTGTPVSDGTHGTPRSGYRTRPRKLNTYTYLYCGLVNVA